MLLRSVADINAVGNFMGFAKRTTLMLCQFHQSEIMKLLIHESFEKAFLSERRKAVYDALVHINFSKFICLDEFLEFLYHDTL